MPLSLISLLPSPLLMLPKKLLPLQKQKLYTADVAAIMQVRAMHGTPKALVRTYGCQQNVADGERMKGMLSEMGFEFTENEDEADFILFNTCAIREHAEDRVFGNIGALNPKPVVGPLVDSEVTSHDYVSGARM